MKEQQNLEYKERITKAFLKTVSAYANYNGGVIIFGINDDGDVVGIDDIKKECMRIENMINTSIEPVPRFSINVENIADKNIIKLIVEKGRDTPYYYNKKAYRRADTSTIEVDKFELRRLVLKGINVDYEQIESSSQNLTFNILEARLKEKLDIKKINLDILKTLNLYKNGYYNVAAELLADENQIRFSGIDIVYFGKNMNQILDRETITGKSLIVQYEKAIEFFERYYQYEEIDGYERIHKELIPKAAFREAVVNAIVHRVWDVNAYIQIAMFKDRIEILSPGGLPEGLTKDEYLNRNISLLRNPIIACVFYRLELIEKFGTGITRIKEAYAESLVKPSFDVSDNYIRIILPVVETDTLTLTEDEVKIYTILKEETELSRSELEKKTRFKKAKLLRIINKLIEKGIIERLGGGVAVTYRLK